MGIFYFSVITAGSVYVVCSSLSQVEKERAANATARHYLWLDRLETSGAMSDMRTLRDVLSCRMAIQFEERQVSLTSENAVSSLALHTQILLWQLL